MANISHFTQTVNGVSTTYDIHDADAVPRSGGAVMTGGTIARTTDTSDLALCGGSSWNDGASITMRGKNHPNAQGFINIGAFASDGTNCGIELNPWGYFQPSADNAVNCGASARRWKVVYAATGTINTSDVRLKNNIKDIDNKLLDAWGNIEPKQYKFNDATEKKGEKARYHTGYLAQDIQAECEKHGVNASEYGLFCYDEWEEQEEVSEEIETEKDGKIIKEKRIIQPKREKGNSYALRYEEALVVECKYLRRCIKQLTARIEELEKGNNTK
jgi:hypothetical protein